MSNYTIELRDIVQERNIFNFNYPFYDEKKRPEFEQDFIKHFYFREIGCETPDRFIHYLEDKMITVFPYYNKLLEASTIEYDILNNYRLTETLERNVERDDNNRVVSSTVGRTQNEQEATSTQKQTTETESNVLTTGNEEEVEEGINTSNSTGKSTTEATGNSSSENSQSTDTENTSDTSTNINNDKTVSNTTTKKFLDTPQGLTDLTNSKYLTSLNQDTSSGTEKDVNKNITTGSGTSKSTVSGTSETDTTNNSETNTTDNSTANSEKTLNRDSTVNQDTTGKETTDNNLTSTVTDEQKRTEDNNIKSHSKGNTTESYKIERVGNIGVDTDSDGILKHIKLQKVLAEIKMMFFEECEDLFMLVY